MLDQARLVSHPGRFLVQLYFDALSGPEGVRARTGALQEDLRRVSDLVIEQAIHKIAV